jgi:hypothetical protein
MINAETPGRRDAQRNYWGFSAFPGASALRR